MDECGRISETRSLETGILAFLLPGGKNLVTESAPGTVGSEKHSRPRSSAAFVRLPMAFTAHYGVMAYAVDPRG